MSRCSVGRLRVSEHETYFAFLCSILALRDGRTPPTELPKPATPAPSSRAHGGHHGSESNQGGGPPGETPIERELRLREEARERLRAKFGAGGLAGASVGSSPMPPSVGSGGGHDVDYGKELAQTYVGCVAHVGLPCDLLG